MILILSAQYLVAEFQVEFGKLPPAFLPLGQRRFYEYHAKLFSGYNESIVLTLPKSFILNDFDSKNLLKHNIEVLFVPDSLGLGESVVYALNMKMPINESVHILHGDIYLKDLQTDRNAIGVMRVDNNYDWEILSEEYNIEQTESFENCDIKKDKEILALSGYFHIQNPYIFIQSIICSQYDYINGLKLYSQSYPFRLILQNGWQDFGLLASYLHAKQIITTQRSFNQLSFKDGFYIKSSLLQDKLKGEMNWFLEFPKELALHIPLFMQLNAKSYKVEYLYLNTLAELFVFGRLSLLVWKNILDSLYDFLCKLHAKTCKTTQINFNYTQKTFERLQEFCTKRNIPLNKTFDFYEYGGGGGEPPIKHFIARNACRY